MNGKPFSSRNNSVAWPRIYSDQTHKETLYEPRSQSGATAAALAVALGGTALAAIRLRRPPSLNFSLRLRLWQRLLVSFELQLRRRPILQLLPRRRRHQWQLSTAATTTSSTCAMKHNDDLTTSSWSWRSSARRLVSDARRSLRASGHVCVACTPQRQWPFDYSGFNFTLQFLSAENRRHLLPARFPRAGILF